MITPLPLRDRVFLLRIEFKKNHWSVDQSFVILLDRVKNEKVRRLTLLRNQLWNFVLLLNVVQYLHVLRRYLKYRASLTN